jgi:hypothetical protein
MIDRRRVPADNPDVAQRRFHYEVAFEHYLRANTIPYVAVDEAKRALRAVPRHHAGASGPDATAPARLKSFDFVVYSQAGPNLLVDVKGRKHSGRGGRSMQNWVTGEDVEALAEWATIFGAGFEPAFVFMFWCETEPPDALFQEMFEFGGRWYAVLAVRLRDYQANQKPRSARWGTVSLPAKAFDGCARPLKELL